MKNLITSVLLLFSLVSQAQMIKGTNKKGATILKEIKNEKAVLIDVRTPEEYASGHLKYAKNIDYKSDNFTALITRLPKTKPVYLYCRSGNRSGKGLDTLLQYGFTRVYNIGGLEDLKAAGLPAE